MFHVHLVELGVNFSSKMTGSPVTGSNGGRISKFASIVAIASQTVASAKCSPGHFLSECVMNGLPLCMPRTGGDRIKCRRTAVRIRIRSFSGHLLCQ